MCSFIFTNKEVNDLDKINFYTKFRGLIKQIPLN